MFPYKNEEHSDYQRQVQDNLRSSQYFHCNESMSSLQDSRLKPSSILSRPYGVGLSLLSVTGLAISSSPQLLCYFNHTVLEALSATNQSRSLVQPQYHPWQPTAHVRLRQQPEATVKGSVFQKPTK